VKCRRCSTYSLIDLSAVNLAIHGLIHRLTYLIGGLGRIVSPFSITKRSSACTKGRGRRVQAALGAKPSFAKTITSVRCQLARCGVKLEAA
jgi:hypothetical protein